MPQTFTFCGAFRQPICSISAEEKAVLARINNPRFSEWARGCLCFPQENETSASRWSYPRISKLVSQRRGLSAKQNVHVALRSRISPVYIRRGPVWCRVHQLDRVFRHHRDHVVFQAQENIVQIDADKYSDVLLAVERRDIYELFLQFQ